MRPEFDVVWAGPVDRPVASRRRAAAMPSLEASPLRRRDHTRRPADVNHLRVGFEDTGQGSITGQALHGLARDRQSVLQLRSWRAELTLQTFDRGVDGDVRPHAVAPGQRALVHGLVGNLDQGVRAALLGRPLIAGADALGQRLDRRLERRPALAVEHA